jgi:hypothetical protein
MNRKERRQEIRAALGLAADKLSEEIRDKLWDHISDLRTKPVAACEEMIRELESGCPGHVKEEYQEAISRSMFFNR